MAGATYRNNARITVTNDPRDPGEEMGPNEKVDFVLPPPTVVNGSVNVDDTNGMSWLFIDSGTQTYTKTFRCDEDKGTHDNTATIRETGPERRRARDRHVQTAAHGRLLAHAGLLDALEVRPRAVRRDVGSDRRGHGVLLEREDVVPGDQHVVRGRERLLHPRPPVHCGEFNLAGGASSTPAVNAALAGAEALYAAYTPTSTLSKAVRAQAIAYARTLADYNEGDIGPGHCPG